MGAPVNKAVFTFATTLFKNKFTKDERDAGKTCYIMGLSFITEGAIPFVASDSVKVIPASIIGAAIAGGLSMMFGVLLPAPHGGIFVFPVVTNPVMYLVSIIIGSLVTAFILGAWKKPVNEI